MPLRAEQDLVDALGSRRRPRRPRRSTRWPCRSRPAARECRAACARSSGRSSGSMQSLLKSMAGSWWPSLASPRGRRACRRAWPARRRRHVGVAAPEPEPKTRPSAPPSGRPSSGRRPASTNDDGAVASACCTRSSVEEHAAAVAARPAAREQCDGLIVLHDHAGPLEHAQRALVDGGHRGRLRELGAEAHRHASGVNPATSASMRAATSAGSGAGWCVSSSLRALRRAFSFRSSPPSSASARGPDG